MIKNKGRFCWLLLLGILAVPGCGGSSSAPSDVVVGNTQPVYPSHPVVWETANPSDQGIDSEKLSAAFDYAFQEGSFTQAVVVIKDGKLIREQYRGMTTAEAESIATATNTNAFFWMDEYESRDQTSEVTSWSTAKSFTSFIVGIAIEQGYIDSIDQVASAFIGEWGADERALITIKSLLDMRSGLVPICFDFQESSLSECENFRDAQSGGNIVYADDQLTACIERPLAQDGTTYVWSPTGNAYSAGDFVYSNCDTMVLGEILFRATGRDLQNFADENLFSQINMTAFWWRDNILEGQANGNYLAYCCLDSSARDYAKFGHMLLLGGIWEDGEQNYQTYTQDILSLKEYGLQFWTFCADPEEVVCSHIILSTVGFDGQYIIIDPANELVIVRASLYKAFQNLSRDRKMKLVPGDVSQSNWTGSVPNALGAAVESTFFYQEFYRRVAQSMR